MIDPTRTQTLTRRSSSPYHLLYRLSYRGSLQTHRSRIAGLKHHCCVRWEVNMIKSKAVEGGPGDSAARVCIKSAPFTGVKHGSTDWGQRGLCSHFPTAWTRGLRFPSTTKLPLVPKCPDWLRGPARLPSSDS
jgi:hypothetical protein